MNPPAGGDSPPRVKRRWQRVDGVLLLDKPIGYSSNQALQAARRLFQAEKAGHTGTLDPLATGLLPLCFGEATKFAGELLGADKRYVARLLLGVTTTTGDAEGELMEQRPVDVSDESVDSVLMEFQGPIQQVPPMYSALKRDGRPLYAYARAGEVVERDARSVIIHSLVRLPCALPYVEFEVHCSKGTYVRTLATDIGERLGCGAHLTALRRTGIGNLGLQGAFTLDELAGKDEALRAGVLAPADALLADLKAITLDVEQSGRMRQGQVVKTDCVVSGRVRIYGNQGAFIGLGKCSGDGLLRPERLVAESSKSN